MSYGFKVLVEGDYACFTRPELKVERVSYDVPTPGALEGMLKSVYWKPAVRYVIDKIIVLKSVYLIATRDLSNLWLQFFLSQNQGFMRLFEKTVLK